MQNLKKHDSVLHKLIQQETNRQQNTLSLIPSENILPSHTNEATASCLANKYAEGYPNKRYYQGMEFVDQIETLAQERAKKLFNVAYANVQPYSGSICNLEAYLSIINPGDKIMGLNLSSGGHLTHGSIASFTGKIFKSISYDVDQNGELNYKEIEKLASKEKPNIIIAGTTAYSKTID
jgi:glycine hydroxymethyltransferase